MVAYRLFKSCYYSKKNVFIIKPRSPSFLILRLCSFAKNKNSDLSLSSTSKVIWSLSSFAIDYLSWSISSTVNLLFWLKALISCSIFLFSSVRFRFGLLTHVRGVEEHLEMVCSISAVFTEKNSSRLRSSVICTYFSSNLALCSWIDMFWDLSRPSIKSRLWFMASYWIRFSF